MLALDAVVAKYGTATALWSVSLTIHAGELVCSRSWDGTECA